MAFFCTLSQERLTFDKSKMLKIPATPIIATHFTATAFCGNCTAKDSPRNRGRVDRGDEHRLASHTTSIWGGDRTDEEVDLLKIEKGHINEIYPQI